MFVQSPKLWNVPEFKICISENKKKIIITIQCNNDNNYN